MWPIVLDENMPMIKIAFQLYLMQTKLDELRENIPQEYHRWLPWIMWGGITLLALLVVRNLWQRIARIIRRRRPAKIHPSLQKYSVDYDKQTKEQQKQAQAIVAASTGNRLAGFRIVRQVDAVFVEGYRTPEEAVVALKADAVQRGANAILNVTTERTSAGKCTASGDAVVADRINPKPMKPENS